MRQQEASDRLGTPLSAPLLSDGACGHATAASGARSSAASAQCLKRGGFLWTGNLI